MKQFADSEVTPDLRAESLVILHSSAKLGDVVHISPGVDARIETHTNGTAENPDPHPHRGVTLYHTDPAVERAMGTDVSHYQAGATLSDPRLRFVFAKAIEGVTVPDTDFDAHWQIAGDRGLLRGAYQFYHGAHSGREQAGAFLDVIDGRMCDLPLVLDVEVASKPYQAVGEDILDWIREITAVCSRPLIYTGPAFWSAMPSTTAEQIASRADLWISHYGVITPRLAKGWSSWSFWQSTGTGRIAGIDGAADADWFNGDDAALRAWCKRDTLPSPAASSDRPLVTVADVQSALNALGARLAVDGKFGPKTELAIKSFQSSHGLLTTGLPDPATLAALAKALASK